MTKDEKTQATLAAIILGLWLWPRRKRGEVDVAPPGEPPEEWKGGGGSFGGGGATGDW